MTDAELIHSHGGPTKVGERFGFTAQRVQNWLTRGIPYKVKVDHPEITRPGPFKPDAELAKVA